MQQFLQQILQILNNAPPNWVQWVTFFLASSFTVLRLIEFWINRRRFEFKVLVAEQYYILFSQEQVEKWDYSMLSPRVGDPREVFMVLEFVLTNKFSQDVTIGRINIGGWMYKDRYSRSIYDHARDYRVFDLHTGSEATLVDYKPLPPGASIALRVEAYEHQGSTWGHEGRNNPLAKVRSRMRVELPSHYDVDVYTNLGKRKFKISFKKRHKIEYRSNFSNIYRLSGSELIADVPTSSPVPQGIKRKWEEPNFRSQLQLRFQRSSSRIWHWKQKILRRSESLNLRTYLQTRFRQIEEQIRIWLQKIRNIF